jgi:hypothetical protein
MWRRAAARAAGFRRRGVAPVVGRELTANERLYVTSVIRARQRGFRAVSAVLALCAVASAAGTIALLVIRFSPVVLLSGFMAALAGWAARVLRARARAAPDGDSAAVLVEGELGSVTVGRRKFVDTIGGRWVDLPSHWRGRVRRGEPVRAEICVTSGAASGVFSHGNLVLSLNDRYRIDREVPCGVLQLGIPGALFLALLTAFVALMSGVAIHAIGLSLPVVFPALLYLRKLESGESFALTAGWIFLASSAASVAFGVRGFLGLTRNRSILKRIDESYRSGPSPAMRR